MTAGEVRPVHWDRRPSLNAASHQSIPAKRDGSEWASNSLPGHMTEEAVAFLLRIPSQPQWPRVPFLNGFCYPVKRSVVDAIGTFDEETFGAGYCEENDYSYRALQAGFELAIVDDATSSTVSPGRTAAARAGGRWPASTTGRSSPNTMRPASTDWSRAPSGTSRSSPSGSAWPRH